MHDNVFKLCLDQWPDTSKGETVDDSDWEVATMLICAVSDSLRKAACCFDSLSSKACRASFCSILRWTYETLELRQRSNSG